MRIALLLLVSWALAGTAATVAQEPDRPGQPAPPRLEPVVVEEPAMKPDRLRTEEEEVQEIQRTPGGVEVVGEQTIRESRGANLRDVLEFVPGVVFRPRFGAADEGQLSIRGSGLQNNFHLRGVNVLLDGFLYGNADGFSDFESLELWAAKRIEIYKGANALRFGANSIGGALNFVNKTGHDAPVLEYRGQFGSFGYAKNYLGTGHVHGPFDLYVGLSDTELQGYRQWSEQVRRRAFGSFGYVLPGGTAMRLDVGYVYNDEQLPGALTEQQFRSNPGQADPSNLIQRAARRYSFGRGAFTLWTPVAEGQAVEWKAQLNYQDMDHPLAFAIIDNVTTNWGTELRYLNDRPLFGLPSSFVAGFQYLGERQIDVNLANDEGRRGDKTKNNLNTASLFGFYAEERLNLTPAFLAVAGGRVDYSPRAVENRFTGATDRVEYLGGSPKLGFVWQVARTAQVFANASHAYQPPLLLEATAPGQIGGDLDQLKATRAWQFEVGTRGTWTDRLQWDLAVYDYELWDEIQNVNVRPFPGAPFTIPRFQNIPRSRHTGVELGLTALLAKDFAPALGLGQAGDALQLQVVYTWGRFVFVNNPVFGNNQIPGLPEHLITAMLRYEHGSGFFVAPYVEAVPQGYFVNSQNTVRTPPYAVANVQMGYTYAPWKLSLYFEGRNLNNVNYVSAVVVDDANAKFFLPGDARAFYGGLAWSW